MTVNHTTQYQAQSFCQASHTTLLTNALTESRDTTAEIAMIPYQQNLQTLGPSKTSPGSSPLTVSSLSSFSRAGMAGFVDAANIPLERRESKRFVMLLMVRRQ
jgi:hypothetical protein